MALNITKNTQRALKEVAIKPNIIVKFEGLDILFSAQAVEEYIKINDPGFYIGAEGYYIGGLTEIQPDKNKTLIDSRSTTFSIRQQINHDEGNSSSISTLTVGLVDKDQFVTLLITPGEIVEEVLGRKVQVFVTFGSVDFFEDSIEIFKGFVSDIDSGAGSIKIKLNHPDNKKKINLFTSIDTALTATVNATDTVFPIENASAFLTPSGPMTTYLRVGSEIVQYTGVVGNSITGITRGQIGTTATGHSANDQVKSLYALEGNPLELALQVMMSGFGTDPTYSGIPISSFVQVGSGVTQFSNAIYFNEINIPQDYGIRAGDTVTVSGASNGANNVVLATVSDVVKFESGYYILLSGATLVLETNTIATLETYTQYNTLPDGMKMKPDEVDIDGHLQIIDFFHPTTEVRIYIKDDETEGKEFLDVELYKPIGCYALPRKSKSSVGFMSGPIPGEDLKVLDETNVKDPAQISINRTQARAYFNEVFFKYEDSPVTEETKFTRGQLYISQDSKNRIPGNNRTYLVESKGLRNDLNALNIIANIANRILDRYKFAAETVSLSTLLRDSVDIEIGDIVLGDFEALQISDITRGDRIFKARFFEVLNKSTNLKTGQTDFDLLDTGLNLTSRFGLISPSSLIKSQLDATRILIKENPLYPTKHGEDEYKNWEKIITQSRPISVVIRNFDFSIIEDFTVKDINENVFTLDHAPSITITEDMIIEFTDYVDTDTSDRQKLIYVYMTDDPNFPDGGYQYSMI